MSVGIGLLHGCNKSDDLSDLSTGRYRTTWPRAADKIPDMPKKPSKFNKAVGERITSLRKALGFEYIRHLAKEMDWGEDQVRAWERGDNCIPPVEAVKLNNRYGVPLDWIYVGDEAGLPIRLHQKLKALAA